jgi:hypothetical protein
MHRITYSYLVSLVSLPSQKFVPPPFYVIITACRKLESTRFDRPPVA